MCLVFALCCRRIVLYDHLRDTLSTERLAALERLPLDASKRVENSRNQQEDSGNHQASHQRPEADPLYDAHDEVDGCAHVVCLEFAYEGVEFSGCRADAEEERYLDEYNYE